MLPTIAPDHRERDAALACALLGRAGGAGAELNDFTENSQTQQHGDGRPRNATPRIRRQQPRKERGKAHDEPITGQRHERRQPRRTTRKHEQQCPQIVHPSLIARL